MSGDAGAAAFDLEHAVMRACPHATPLGKVAGHNALADLLGRQLRDFTPGPYVTCLDLVGAGGPPMMATGAAGAASSGGSTMPSALLARAIEALSSTRDGADRPADAAIHPPVADAARVSRGPGLPRLAVLPR
ncbi:hypothetical protein [Asanoa iriomotensis]|uniref:Uncharacterized protein n=1 Tax=Asanoa iriomotensis TaxID=234613 RepID=A0ABQ4BYX5_9ACTN|nr:hypothetical protein [Asanoa iriomotensis]GIF55255.1 hypothetical protein Air01nite_13500 [Asanoa iriomotensis]